MVLVLESPGQNARFLVALTHGNDAYVTRVEALDAADELGQVGLL